MKFKLDHDYHIHTYLSPCAGDMRQTPQAVLEKAKHRGYSSLCLTDHYWDASIPITSCCLPDYDWISQALPLPQDKGVKYLFGCEADMGWNFEIGIPQNKLNDFDFILIPTTHMHMMDFTVKEEQVSTNEKRAKLWVNRLEALFNQSLPFYKIGIPHLACTLINPKSREDYLETLDMIPSEDMYRLFEKATRLGVGIELNYADFLFSDDETDRILRMFRIAKECGCKFFYGSDEHRYNSREDELEVMGRAIDLLELKESDKFFIVEK